MNSPAIVLVTSSFPISGDGSEAAGGFVADLTEELAKHAPVRVVAPGRAGQRECWSGNIDVFRYATPDMPLSTLKLWQPVGALQALRVMAAGKEATARAMAAGPVVHVLALWALPCGAWARWAARRHGCGYSVWTLGSDIWTLGRIPVLRTYLAQVLVGARHCFSDGLQLAEDTRAIAGREVEFLPSTRRFPIVAGGSAGPGPKRLLFLGRWHPNKGVDMLLEALRRLPDAVWREIAEVHIAGGGPLEREVHAAVAALAVAGRPVRISGFLDTEAAAAAFHQADALLLPSRIESIPVVFSDAMKAGVPVVATPVGDLPQLLRDGPTGVLAGAVDAEAFAAAIEALLATPDFARFTPGIANMAARFSLSGIAAYLASRLRPGGTP